MVIESSASIKLCMTKHPSQKVTNFRHLLGCDTIATVVIFVTANDSITISI